MPIVTPTPTIFYVLKNECEPFTLFDLGIECVTLASPSTSVSNDGALSLLITGGTTPYTILWDNGKIGPSIFNLTAGSYGVTVTDYYGDYTARTICNLYGPTPEPTPTITPTPTPTVPPTYPNLCFILYYPTVTTHEIAIVSELDLVITGNVVLQSIVP